MPGGVATPQQLAAFLENDPRQVWAIDRVTSKPYYLVEGAADAVRAHAREHLRCPHPECDAPITTRGGTRRDHFVHLSETTHPGGPESEQHLAGKTMIAAWLQDPARPHASNLAAVRVEVTVKQRDSADDALIHRRPDVLAATSFGARIAFEVECKPWSVAAWQRKDDDLRASGIRTHWLVGHNRLTAAADPDGSSKAQRLDAVNVPEPWRHAASTGQRILIINPEKRQLAELAETGGGHYRGEGRVATLRISDVDACYLDVTTGHIITPFTADLTRLAERKISAATNRRLRAEERDRKEQEKAAALELVREAEQAAWLGSDYRLRTIETFGSVPWWMTSANANQTAWAAHPSLWRAVIWFDLVDQSSEAIWSTIDDASATLRAAGISPRPGFEGQDETISRLIENLANARLVELDVSPLGQVLALRRSAIPVTSSLVVDHTRSPAERLLAMIHALPMEEIVRDQTLWLKRFPEARTVPTVNDEGKVRFVPRSAEPAPALPAAS